MRDNDDEIANKIYQTKDPLVPSNIAKDENLELKMYIQKISQFPILSKAEEDELVEQYFKYNNKEAGKKLILCHLRLVVKMAIKYRNYGIPVMDMISEGSLGLAHALKKFDMKKEVRFSTYALLWIKSSIQECILRSWSLVKGGSTALRKKFLFNLGQTKKMLKIDEKTDINTENKLLASALGVKEIDIVETRKSMNQLGDIENKNIGEEFATDLENDDEYKYQITILKSAFATLNDREREIIVSRYMNDNNKITLESLASKFGISKERARQIEAEAIIKIKNFAKNIR